LLAGCQTAARVLPVSPSPEPSPTPAPADTPTAPAGDDVTGFEAFLAEALASRRDGRQALASRYLAGLTELPLTAGDRAVFLWRGEAQDVRLTGDMNAWDAPEASPLARLDGSDLWYLEMRFEPDARLDYRFLVEGDDYRLDPLNPRTVPAGLGLNSELAMPDYQPPPELEPAAGPVPAGALNAHTLDSAFLNEVRTFFVYEPAGEVLGQKRPLVIFNDGSDFLNLIDAPAILDRLIAARQIPPLVAVFVPPIHRNEEYLLNEAYASFLADELVPYVRRTYDTAAGRDQTGVLGVSHGAVAALYAAASRPDIFGRAAGLSGDYAIAGGRLFPLLSAAVEERDLGGSSSLPLRLYLAAGSYDTAVEPDAPGDLSVLDATQRLVEYLDGQEHEYAFDVRPEGHSWGFWRALLAPALSYLFG
jgi:enterochelin esterase family protein